MSRAEETSGCNFKKCLVGHEGMLHVQSSSNNKLFIVGKAETGECLRGRAWVRMSFWYASDFTRYSKPDDCLSRKLTPTLMIIKHLTFPSFPSTLWSNWWKIKRCLKQEDFSTMDSGQISCSSSPGYSSDLSDQRDPKTPDHCGLKRQISSGTFLTSGASYCKLVGRFMLMFQV